MKVKVNITPGFLLWKAANSWQKKLKKALSVHNLTHVQFILLSNLYYLEQEREKVSLSNISASANTDLMMTSQVVKTLISKGLVIKQSDPEDSRAFVLQTTPSGRRLSLKAMEIVDKTDQEIFDKISNLTTFRKNLTQLVDDV